MKLYFWNGQPNFGDRLNLFLWPKIFPGILDDDNDELFLGIGSIIWSGHSPNSVKHVFGSGYGGGLLPSIDEKWKFHFVRGPKTALSLGIPPSLVITDPAVLVKKFFNNDSPKKYKVSLMPHWSADKRRYYYRKICYKHGVNYISPLNEPESIIEEILSSELLLTEALHGAIVADAFRIPWIPVDVHGVNSFKWEDWCESMGLTYTPLQFGKNTVFKKTIKNIRLLDALYIGYCLGQYLHSTRIFLSKDNILDSSIERIQYEIEKFRQISDKRIIES